MSDLGETYGDTNITVSDLAEIGAAVLNLAGTSVLMRHANPVGSTDYAHPDRIAGWVAWHFARWCGGFDEQGSQALLVRLLNESGWLKQMQVDGETEQEAAA